MTQASTPKGPGIHKGLWLQVLGALLGGALVGVLLSSDFNMLPADWVVPVTNWLAFPGLIFLACLKMIVVPLVLVSVIAGVMAAGNIVSVREMGLKVVAYFVCTTSIAVAIGSSLAYVIAPGSWVDQGQIQSVLASAEAPASAVQGVGGFADIPAMVAGLLPSNPLAAMVEGALLQIVIFAALFGCALLAIPKTQSKPIIGVVESTQTVLMKVVEWVLVLTPYAVFGLVAKAVSNLGLQVLGGLVGYTFTVLFALVVMGVVYAIILQVIAKTKPTDFWPNIREAQAVAFATSSSAATMPVTMKVAEKQLKLPKSVSRFVIPLGTTINMDGTALYQAVATVFLAQVFGINIGFEGMVMVVVMALAASIGTPGLPGVGIVVLASILLTVGIPPEGVALILGVDRFLDMCRTTLNITGDLVATRVMSTWQAGKAAS